MFNIINKFTSDKEIDINDEIEITDENYINEAIEEEEDTGNEVDTQTEETDRIDENDEDENNIKRKYIISVGGIPFYFHDDLETARRYMWSIGNNFISPTEHDNDGDYYITTSNINHIKIMKTYDFYFFRYSSIIDELKIDYVIPCKI
jgi:hypothetical protein